MQFGDHRCLSTNNRRPKAASSKPNPRPKERGGLNTKNYDTVEELANAAFNKLNELTPKGLASFWMRVSQLIGAKSKYQKVDQAKQPLTGAQQRQLMSHLEPVFLKTMGEIPKFKPRELSLTALGLAKIGKNVDDPKMYGTPLHPHGTPQQILHAIIIGDHSKKQDAVFQSIGLASRQIISEFRARDLSSLTYANATIDYVPIFDDESTLFDHIAERSIPIIDKFQPQELSNMAWSYEKANVKNPPLFIAVAKQILEIQRLGKFKPQELANILLAYAQAGMAHHKFFKKVADLIFSPHNNRNSSLNPPLLAKITMAFAVGGEPHPRLFQIVGKRIVSMDNLESFQPANITNILWAFAEAREPHPKLFEVMEEYIVSSDVLHAFEPKDLSNMVWAFAQTVEVNPGEKHPRFFQKVAEHIIGHSLEGYTRRDLSIISVAFNKAEENYPRMMKRMGDYVKGIENIGGMPDYK